MIINLKVTASGKNSSKVTNYDEYVKYLSRVSDELDDAGIDPEDVADNILKEVKGLRTFLKKEYGLTGKQAEQALGDDIYMGRPANLRRR